MSSRGLLDVRGKRTAGESVRSQNVTAVKAIANIVRSSLGPVGLDKMLVDDVGVTIHSAFMFSKLVVTILPLKDVVITNDGATILRMLEVKHPAGKIMVELAQLQDKEVGDGTTSVVILAAELLKFAEDLIKQKVHPSIIMSGYRLACRESVKYMEENLTINVDDLGREGLIGVAKTSMSSKLISIEADFFANLVIDALEKVKVQDGSSFKYPVKAINILKALGGSTTDTVLVNGYALNCTMASEGMPRHVSNAKIACLNLSLKEQKMDFGLKIIIKDAGETMPMLKEEANIGRRRVEKIIKSGANVVLVSGGLSDLCVKQFVTAGVMAVRRCKVADLKRIAKATGATLISSLVGQEADESFDASLLGHADEVVQERINDDELVFIKGPKARSASSIILRGANEHMLDEMERSIHDALCSLKRVLESRKVVVGGGSVEMATSVFLENFANSVSSRAHLGLAEYAEALIAIPRVLAVNAGQDCSDLIAKLRAYHAQQITEGANNKWKWAGLDLETGEVRDNKAACIFEPLESKVKILKFATEAALTILRIDDMIQLEKQKERDRPGRPY
ncbi:T complex protein 1 subunit alpha [Trichuris trichiura]|uniref:T-complex protein 1 subunit alpha n=1 Tax=Trichuris trichiura TaxID=36087 RepID=A0A077Z5D8_TRITR|nr:T complex protein 1 subunit alpha [Trichuris trichiura]